ncbi:MAG: hypothetical protein canaca05_13550 [Anaerolineaceae bacterium]
MVKKSTLILLIIAIILVVAYVWLQNQGGLDFNSHSDEPTATSLPHFIRLESSNLVLLKLTRPEQEDLIISKSEDGGWQINVPGASVTEGNIAQIVAEFNAIQVKQQLNLDLDLTTLGLDNPQYSFTLTQGDGTQHIIKIGSANPLNTDYYAQLDAGAPVLVSQGSIDNIVSIIESAATPPTPTPAPTETDG